MCVDRLISCSLQTAMKSTSHAQVISDNIIDSRRLIIGLRHALDVNYARVLDHARSRWECYFESCDPSNACVSVRITSGKPTAGVIKKPARSLVFAARRVAV